MNRFNLAVDYLLYRAMLETDAKVICPRCDGKGYNGPRFSANPYERYQCERCDGEGVVTG